MNDFNVTTFFAVPTIFSAILDFITSKNFGGFKNLKLSVSAGEALPENIGKKWYELNANYGLFKDNGFDSWVCTFLKKGITSVSYTHLTLPTNREV